MYPVLFHLGSLTVTGYAALVDAGLLAGAATRAQTRPRARRCAGGRGGRGGRRARGVRRGQVGYPRCINDTTFGSPMRRPTSPDIGPLSNQGKRQAFGRAV